MIQKNQKTDHVSHHKNVFYREKFQKNAFMTPFLNILSEFWLDRNSVDEDSVCDTFFMFYDMILFFM